MYSDNVDWIPSPCTRLLITDKAIESHAWHPLSNVAQKNQGLLTVEQIEDAIQGNDYLTCVTKLHWEEVMLKAFDEGKSTNDLTGWARVPHFQAVDLDCGACIFVDVYLEKTTKRLKLALDRNRTSAVLWGGGGSIFQDTPEGNWFITNLVLHAPLHLFSELIGQTPGIDNMPVLSKIVDLKIQGII